VFNGVCVILYLPFSNRRHTVCDDDAVYLLLIFCQHFNSVQPVQACFNPIDPYVPTTPAHSRHAIACLPAEMTDSPVPASQFCLTTIIVYIFNGSPLLIFLDVLAG
jgi:hypothetical protein